MQFAGASGALLAATAGHAGGAQAPRAFVLFAHCFTCSQGHRAPPRRWREALADAGHGDAALRLHRPGRLARASSPTPTSRRMSADLVGGGRLAATRTTGAPALLVGPQPGRRRGARRRRHGSRSATAVATINAPVRSRAPRQAPRATARRRDPSPRAPPRSISRRARCAIAPRVPGRHRGTEDRAGAVARSEARAAGACTRPRDSTVSCRARGGDLRRGEASEELRLARRPPTTCCTRRDDARIRRRTVLGAWAPRYLPAARARANPRTRPRRRCRCANTREGKFQQTGRRSGRTGSWPTSRWR